jgi:hypothetical protein
VKVKLSASEYEAHCRDCRDSCHCTLTRAQGRAHAGEKAERNVRCRDSQAVSWFLARRCKGKQIPWMPQFVSSVRFIHNACSPPAVRAQSGFVCSYLVFSLASDRGLFPCTSSFEVSRPFIPTSTTPVSTTMRSMRSPRASGSAPACRHGAVRHGVHS